MTSRLGLLTPPELDAEAKEFYDTIIKYLCAKYSDGRPPRRNVREDGALLGPFGVHLHTPAVGQHFHGLGAAVEKMPGFGQRSREIAILTTASRYQAAYAVNAHLTISQAAGLTRDEIDTLLKAKVPEHFSDDDKLVQSAAHELVYGSGPLSDDKWNKLVERFSLSGAKHFVHLVGFYSYLMTVLNGFDAKLPEVE